MKNAKSHHAFFTLFLIFGLLIAVQPVMGMDYTLFIFGNANEDADLDQRDIELLEKIIAGQATATALADANRDGKVDTADIEQVKKIMAATADQIIVQDAYGRPVVVKTPVERIVSMDQMIAENAQVLGIGNKIVGIDKNTVSKSTIHPEISKMTNIGASNEPDIEMIVALKPDLVVSNQYFGEELMKKLEAVHLTPLSMIYHGDIQNSLGYSKMLGYLTGAPASATVYIEWMSGILDGIHNRLAAIPYEQRTRVIYLYPRKSGALGSGGNNCPTIRTLQYLGANTMTDKTRNTDGTLMDTASYFEIDPEVVLEKNPEVIVMEDFDTALGYSFTDPEAARAELDKVKARPGFDKLEAVKNNQVYLLDVNIVSHSNCLGAIYMAKSLYPSELDGVDPYAIHQEYVDRFLKLSGYDVKKDGIFIFPQLEQN